MRNRTDALPKPAGDLDLPNIDKNNSKEDELPGANKLDGYQIEETNLENVTMLDNLPLLEYNDDLEDFETLMNIADDNENSD